MPDLVSGSVGMRLLERLVREGVIPEPERARKRFRLGYPVWLILEEELGRQRTTELLSEASDVPVLHKPLTQALLDVEAARAYGPLTLKRCRWAPLVGGEIVVADPFSFVPSGELSDREVRIASASEIDAVLGGEFPDLDWDLRKHRRLGRLLLDEGVVSEEELVLILEEQERSGGRLGDILLAHGWVNAQTLTRVLSRRLGLTEVVAGEAPHPLLPARFSREWQAVALSVTEAEDAEIGDEAPIPVAFVDPGPRAIEAVQGYLGRPILPKLTDQESLNALSGALYAAGDVEEVVGGLLEKTPHFSAFGNRLSAFQLASSLLLTAAVIVGVILTPMLTAVVAAAVGTFLYVLYGLYRMYTAWRGWGADSTIHPTIEDRESLSDRDLPVYTLLLPVYKEKPSTMRALFESLAKLDYPKHKLDGILLVEEDDEQTLETVEKVGKPGWLRTLSVPETSGGTHGSPADKLGKPGWLKVLKIPSGEPRTKPKAMIYGLLYAKGDLITIYDAEDQPEPHQLKEAVWGFRQADDSVACIQAKLNYYNPRQNLLTRWFSLEYSAWFDMFLPGLHRLNAPIPLGGTSNHFRADVLKESMSWDPYNVTEDADLGLRLARIGKTTRMLDSTTYEEANSRVGNWIRQRSRWIKGYMQTFLVHTRDPLKLCREIGFKNALYFLATIGGLIYTVLISPIFWVLLLLWLLFTPGWIPQLFPGPVYYLVLVSLFFGNFFFVFLALVGAVGRGNDDLAPHTLLIPIYWLMMSAAGYMALYELIVRPYYWQKTEHGLHFEEEPEESLQSP